MIDWCGLKGAHHKINGIHVHEVMAKKVSALNIVIPDKVADD